MSKIQDVQTVSENNIRVHYNSYKDTTIYEQPSLLAQTQDLINKEKTDLIKLLDDNNIPPIDGEVIDRVQYLIDNQK